MDLMTYKIMNGDYRTKNSLAACQQRFQEIASFAESSLLRFANFFSSEEDTLIFSGIMLFSIICFLSIIFSFLVLTIITPFDFLINMTSLINE